MGDPHPQPFCLFQRNVVITDAAAGQISHPRIGKALQILRRDQTGVGADRIAAPRQLQVSRVGRLGGPDIVNAVLGTELLAIVELVEWTEGVKQDFHKSPSQAK